MSVLYMQPLKLRFSLKSKSLGLLVVQKLITRQARVFILLFLLWLRGHTVHWLLAIFYGRDKDICNKPIRLQYL